MRKKKISFGLSESEIDRAIREIEAEKQYIIEKTEELQKKIADRIEKEAQTGFNGAVLEDIIPGYGYAKSPQVTVSSTSKGDIEVVIAYGEDAIWIEFGAGVYHNGAVGGSPHPKGVELGYTIGGYGLGNGRKKVWGFNRDGELHLTHGTPAAMPLAKAVSSVCNEIVDIARGVFV